MSYLTGGILYEINEELDNIWTLLVRIEEGAAKNKNAETKNEGIVDDIDRWTNRIKLLHRNIAKHIQMIEAIHSKDIIAKIDVRTRITIQIFDETYKQYNDILDRLYRDPQNFSMPNQEEQNTVTQFKNITRDMYRTLINNEDSNRVGSYASIIGGRGRFYHADNETLDALSVEFTKTYGITSAVDLINRICKTKRGHSINVMLSGVDKFPGLTADIKHNSENANIYATFHTDTFTEYNNDYRKMLNKVAIGDACKLMIRNRSMDIIYARATINDQANEYYVSSHCPGQQNSRLCYDLSRYYRYLRNNGLLILSVPTFMLHSNECKIIADDFKFIGAYKTNEVPTNDNLTIDYTINNYFTYVTLVLSRKVEGDKTEDETFERCFYLDNAPLYSEAVDNIIKNIPEDFSKGDAIDVNLFRGPIGDQILMSIILDETPISEDVWREKFNEHKPAPLLPFKKSQVGQVLASGKLDGVIDEGDGYKHVIKGNVSKAVRRKEEYKIVNGRNCRVRTEIINNVVSISMFNSNGERKSITMSE